MYHVYSNAVKLYVGQKITFKREHKNPYNNFAIPGKVTMKEKIGLIAAGHVPRELSRYIWFSLEKGHKEKPIASPLVQGGLEIPIKVSITQEEPEILSILVAKMKEVESFLTEEYVNDSENILHELGIEEDEDDDVDVEFQMEAVDNKEIQML